MVVGGCAGDDSANQEDVMRRGGSGCVIVVD